MKTKTITLSFKVPAKYKWVAVQPFGEITLFTRKPKVVKGKAGYWDLQRNEIRIEDPDILQANKFNDEEWKKTLKKI